MGYELKLHIGECFSDVGGDMPDAQGTPTGLTYEQTYGRSIGEIASVDLSNPGSQSRISKLAKEAIEAQEEAIKDGAPEWKIATNYYDEDHTSDVYLREDRYGKPIAAIPLADVLEALKLDWEDSKPEYAWEHGYRRFKIAIALIEPIIETFGNDPEHPLLALTFGH